MSNKDLKPSSEIELRDFSELEASIQRSASILKREYLNRLTECSVSELPKSISGKCIKKFVRFYKLSKLVYHKKESFLEKLTTIARAASISNSSLVTVISSNGADTSFWIGAVNKAFDDNRTDGLIKTLVSSLNGSFYGSAIDMVDNDSAENKLNGFSEYHVVSAISNVASLRDEEGDIEKYTQGIENLIEALHGKEYTIITIADPISNQESSVVLDSLEQLYSQLSGFEKTEMSMNENSSISNSEQYSKSYADAIGTNTSTSQSHTTQSGWNESTSHSKSKTTNMGAVAVALAGIAAVGVTVATGGLAAVAGAAVAGTAVSSTAVAGSIGAAAITAGGSVAGGLIGSKTKGTANSEGTSGAVSDTHTKVQGINETKTVTTSKGTTYGKTIGSGRTLSFSVENKTVKNVLDSIDLQIERLRECASYGSFSACTYVLTKNIEVNMVASSLFNALISGKNSDVQVAKVNSWGMKDGEETKVKQIISYLSKLSHPQFTDYDSKEFTPASLISGKELAIQLGFPKKSIQGLSVVNKVPFGRNVLPAPAENRKAVPIGKLYHMGKADNSDIKLDVDSLTSHILISGSTGTGKTNATCRLLEGIASVDSDLRFMVVEPAKGEYKHAFYQHPSFTGDRAVHVYGTNPKKTDLLRIDPFSFPDDIHILEHVDRLVEILNVCWPMYAAMPAILKNSIIKAYEKCGWDITNSCIPKNQKAYPGFSDVLQCISEILEDSAFSADNKGDYTGALCTRVESLTTGLNGQILSSEELSCAELFESNVIVDLSRVGSIETKALFMGILVMKLQEYRMAEEAKPNQPLRHIMVLEEAHNLLKKTSTEQSQESSNLTGKSVEMITNAIAEMRTYGEGFFIVDQAPNLLDEAAIRNTNTKIVFKLPEGTDRETVGKSMALTDEQILELSKLEIGCAAVYQNDWEEAVLCQFEQYHKDPQDLEKDKELYKYTGNEHIRTQSEIKKDILKLLVDLVLNENQAEKADRAALIEKLLQGLNAPYSTKTSVRRLIGTDKRCDVNDISGTVAALYGTKRAIENAKDSPDIEAWNESIVCSADPELRRMSKKYMDVFVQCLLVEHLKTHPEFEPYVESWKLRMREV